MPRYGGRSKGTPNKTHANVEEIARATGIDPFHVLMMVVANDWEGLGYDKPTTTQMLKDGGTIEVDRITLDHRVNAAKEASKYLYAQRKAIELAGPNGSEVGIKIIIDDFGK